MLTIQDWLRQNNQHSQQIFNQSDLRRLVGYLLGHDNAWLFANLDHVLDEHDTQQLNQWVDQLINGYPLAYITGQQLFWDLDLCVDQNTLIPRADTETILDTVTALLSDQQPKHILDLGTGSGALALALARLFPDAQVMGIDRSTAALTIANKNAKRNQISNVQFLQSDWFSNIGQSKFDLIVSNPPYIAADDVHLAALKYEPRDALVADENGLGDFIRISKQAKNHLHDHGILMFEHGWQQSQSVQTILSDAGFNNVTSAKDLAGHDRVTYGMND